MGYSPVRIDLITVLDGLTSDEIWSNRQPGTFGKHSVFYLNKATFVKNKKTIGRYKDLADLEALDEV